MKKLDYIIVGQGIAGTTLAYRLLKMGRTVKVIDQYNPSSSSNVSTGIINPITGRKLVKSWMIDELLPTAKKLYRQMEMELNIQFYFDRSIYKVFPTVVEQNRWIEKQIDEDYQAYMSSVHYPNWGNIKTPFGVGEIKQAAWLDLHLLIKTFRAFLEERGWVVNEEFDYDKLFVSDTIEYEALQAKNIVFCEGFQGRYNPFFDDLPFSFAKGEVMIIETDDLKDIKGIVSKNGQLIPLKENKFAVGSTFKWKDMSEVPTEEGTNQLKKKIENITAADYTIVEQKAGIRPTVKDRRPFLGASNKAENVFIFNGLGTKGISLSPYFSTHLIEHIENKSDLISEVDIARFSKL